MNILDTLSVRFLARRRQERLQRLRELERADRSRNMHLSQVNSPPRLSHEAAFRDCLTAPWFDSTRKPPC